MSTERYGDLLLPSGGYRRLKSFQLAQLIYDITVHFVNLYIPKESRTCDQMVQAARSGVQNIAEGSVDAATSTKLELNLYNVARASLEELKLDYQDYLRQHGEKIWNKDDLFYMEFVKRRINCKKEFREFIVWAENYVSVPIRTIPYKSVLVANSTLLLIETASYFLKRQIQRKSALFLENGGFSERMHNMRMQKRKNQ
jgi:four helix bundle suffix protein